MEDEGGTDIDDLASVAQRDGKDQPARRVWGELGFVAWSHLMGQRSSSESRRDRERQN